MTLPWQNNPNYPHQSSGPLGWFTSPTATSGVPQKGWYNLLFESIGNNTGNGNLAVLTKQKYVRSMAFNSDGGLSIPLNERHYRSIPLSGIGLPTMVGYEVYAVNLNFQGNGSLNFLPPEGLTITTVEQYVRAFSFSGSGGMTVAEGIIYKLNPALSGSGSLTFNIYQISSVSEGYIGVGTLTMVVSTNNATSMPFAGNGILTQPSSGILGAAVPEGGNGTLGLAAFQRYPSGINTVSDGNLSVVTAQVYSSIHQLLGAGLLTMSAAAQYIRSQIYAGSGNLTLATIEAYLRAEGYSGVGNLTMASLASYLRNCDLAGDGALTMSATGTVSGFTPYNDTTTQVNKDVPTSPCVGVWYTLFAQGGSGGSGRVGATSTARGGGGGGGSGSGWYRSFAPLSDLGTLYSLTAPSTTVKPGGATPAANTNGNPGQAGDSVSFTSNNGFSRTAPGGGAGGGGTTSGGTGGTAAGAVTSSGGLVLMSLSGSAGGNGNGSSGGGTGGADRIGAGGGGATAASTNAAAAGGVGGASAPGATYPAQYTAGAGGTTTAPNGSPPVTGALFNIGGAGAGGAGVTSAGLTGHGGDGTAYGSGGGGGSGGTTTTTNGNNGGAGGPGMVRLEWTDKLPVRPSRIAVGAGNRVQLGTANTSISTSWLCNTSTSDDQTVAIVEVACSVTATATGTLTGTATYGGVAMTLLGATPFSTTTTNGAGIACFYLFNPPTGPQTVSVTLTGTTTKLTLQGNSVVYDKTTTVKSWTTSTTAGNTQTSVNVPAYDAYSMAIGIGCRDTAQFTSAGDGIISGTAQGASVAGFGDFSVMCSRITNTNNGPYSMTFIGPTSTPILAGACMLVGDTAA